MKYLGILLFAFRSSIYSLFLNVKFKGVPFFNGTLPVFHNGRNIVIGKGFRTRGFQHKIEIGTGKNGNINIGNNVFINQGVNIFSEKSIYIGNNVKIGDLCSICDTDFHEIEENSIVRVKKVTIHKNVWIGRSSIILPGVEIGENSVIAAGSIVTKPVPPNCLFAGNPAKFIRTLEVSENFIRK